MNPMDLTNRQLAAFLISLFVCAALVAIGVAHVELMSTPFALLAPAGGRRSSGGDSMRPPAPPAGPQPPPRGPSVLGLAGALVFLLVLSCRTPSSPATPVDIVDAGAQVADGVCSLIEGIDDDGAVRSICATVDEIAQIVSFITMLRSSEDAGARRAGETCEPIPQSASCATSRERAKAILFVVRVRAARFTLSPATP